MTSPTNEQQRVDVAKLEAEQEFLRDWLQYIDSPNPVCCGNSVVGAEYGGMQEMVCCGCPDADYVDLTDVVTAMNARLRQVDAALANVGAAK